MKKIILPTSVKEIGSLKDNDNLEYIVMPIGNGNFKKYFGFYYESVSLPKFLKTVEIVGNPTVLPESYFEDCSSLQNIILPDTIEILENKSMRFCRNLKYLKIPEKLKEIRSEALAYSGLKNVSLPEGIEKVADGAFSRCPELIEVNVPSTIKILSGGAFWESAVANLSIKSKNITIEYFLTRMNRL